MDETLYSGDVVSFAHDNKRHIGILYSNYMHLTVEMMYCPLTHTVTLEYQTIDEFTNLQKADENDVQALIGILTSIASNPIDSCLDKARCFLEKYIGMDAPIPFSVKDEVLVRDHERDEWMFGIYSHFSTRNDKHCANGGYYKYCIRFCEDTKHLLGTK